MIKSRPPIQSPGQINFIAPKTVKGFVKQVVDLLKGKKQ